MACGAPHSPQNPTAPSETLVWQDEFDGQGLPGGGRWNYEVGLIRNHERQYYTRDRVENARVERGKLVDKQTLAAAESSASSVEYEFARPCC
jgi:hypothetical protein